MKDFAGKIAVVTGAASGIGLAIAAECVRAGMKVVLADVEAGALAAAGAKLEALGGAVRCVRTDVARRCEVEDLARRALDAFGGVHLLVNNAGVAAGGAPWDATWNDWEWVLGVNLWGVIQGVKVFTPILLEQGGECHIVNTASTAGLMCGGFSAPYAVSKHAVVALSENLYMALRRRGAAIGVSVLCPGPVRTNVVDAERNRPVELRNEPVELSSEMQAGRAAVRAHLSASMAPSRVAEMVFAAIRNEQFYVLTHPEWMAVVRLRLDRLLAMENPADPAPLVARLLNAPARSGQDG